MTLQRKTRRMQDAAWNSLRVGRAARVPVNVRPPGNVPRRVPRTGIRNALDANTRVGATRARAFGRLFLHKDNGTMQDRTEGGPFDRAPPLYPNLTAPCGSTV